MGVEFWLYTSKSLIPGNEADVLLSGLVDHWKESNRIGSITGALIFTGSMFAQYIEGHDPVLSILRDLISADGRHEDVKTIYAGSSETRAFGQWTLAYSGYAVPYERLVMNAHHGSPMVGRTLLLEMMRRFTSGT